MQTTINVGIKHQANLTTAARIDQHIELARQPELQLAIENWTIERPNELV